MATGTDAPGGRRARTKAANRAAILEAATEVFADLGYGAATVRDIVRRTGLASGTFYNYFPDKEAVLRALLDDVAVELRARVKEARAGTTTLEAFIAEGFRAYYRFFAEDRRLFAVMRRNAGTIRSLFDEPALGAGRDELAEDIRAGVAAGLFPAEIDAETLSAAMVGAGFEVAVRMLDGDPPDVEAAVDFITRLFVGGVAAMRD